MNTGIAFWKTKRKTRIQWGCSSVGRAPALQAGGQEFESLHLHLPKWLWGRRLVLKPWKWRKHTIRVTYAPQELCSFGRVQARYKIEYSDLLMEASFQHKSKHPILHTYLENRILNKNELNIQNQNIKTSEAIQEIVWKKQTCKCESVYKQT